MEVRAITPGGGGSVSSLCVSIITVRFYHTEYVLAFAGGARYNLIMLEQDKYTPDSNRIGLVTSTVRRWYMIKVGNVDCDILRIGAAVAVINR